MAEGEEWYWGSKEPHDKGKNASYKWAGQYTVHFIKLRIWDLKFWFFYIKVPFQSVVAQSILIFATPWTTACQASLSITNSQSLLKLMSIMSVMPSNHLHPLSSPSPPAFNLFQHQCPFQSQFFTSGGQSNGASAWASVFTVNNQDWFPLQWTSLISLVSKGLSRVFSNTTVQKHRFFGAQFSLCSNSHIRMWLLEKP